MSCQLYPERSAGGGGGVSGELGDLSNVTISSVQDGQIISYNSTLGIWVNTANAGGGGGGGGGAQTGDNVSIFVNDTGYVTLNDLGSAATTDSTAYATSAQGLLADSALQSGDLNPVLFTGQSDFPSASTVHGAIAHSHSDGAMYFAHNSVWNKLANYSDLSSVGGDVTSVAGRTGDVTLDSTDISGLGTAATTDSGDYATSAQGSLADSAVQSGDNISLLSNDAGYITEAGEAPVQSVAGRTGHVTLDYTDIANLGDVVTTSSGDYATSAEGSLAVTALQSGDNVSSLTNDAGYLTGVTTGTAAAFDVGTGANNIVQLDGSAKLPAVDGSQLTGVTIDGTELTSIGQVGGTKFLREDGDGSCSFQTISITDENLRGTEDPHIGAFANQSLKVLDNPFESAMILADVDGTIKFIAKDTTANIFIKKGNNAFSRLAEASELPAFIISKDSGEPDIELTDSDGEKYSVINGDSDTLGANGLPARQGYQVPSIGANPAPLLISGGTIS